MISFGRSPMLVEGDVAHRPVISGEGLAARVCAGKGSSSSSASRFVDEVSSAGESRERMHKLDKEVILYKSL